MKETLWKWRYKLPWKHALSVKQDLKVQQYLNQNIKEQ